MLEFPKESNENKPNSPNVDVTVYANNIVTLRVIVMYHH